MERLPLAYLIYMLRELRLAPLGLDLSSIWVRNDQVSTRGLGVISLLCCCYRCKVDLWVGRSSLYKVADLLEDKKSF